MIKSPLFPALVVLGSLSWMMFAAMPASGAEPPQPPAVDPLKDLRDVRKDVRKRIIERPTEKLLRDAAGLVPGGGVAGFVNPKVAPGRVQWHADFAAACEASKKSSKPVLLFQMMGKLDDQFC